LLLEGSFKEEELGLFRRGDKETTAAALSLATELVFSHLNQDFSMFKKEIEFPGLPGLGLSCSAFPSPIVQTLVDITGSGHGI